MLGYVACFSLFTHVLKVIPLGVAYAIWSGIGTALTALIGAALFGEALSTQKVGALAVIVAGVVPNPKKEKAPLEAPLDAEASVE